MWKRVEERGGQGVSRRLLPHGMSEEILLPFGPSQKSTTMFDVRDLLSFQSPFLELLPN